MITTLDTVKTRLGIQKSDVVDDALFNRLISGTSARFENECNRIFGYQLNAIEEIEGDEMEIRVSCYPIDESQPISFDYQDRAADGWQPQTSVDYIVRKGCVISIAFPLTRWSSKARVTYSGGYKLPDNTSPAQATVALPADLENAALEQIAYWYQNKDRLGLVSISGEGGTIQQFRTLDLLPSVTAVLVHYERWMA